MPIMAERDGNMIPGIENHRNGDYTALLDYAIEENQVTNFTDYLEQE